MDFGPEVSSYEGMKVGVYGGKFFPFHRGHLSFILKAQSMVDVLFVVVQHDEVYERSLLSGSDFVWVDAGVREAWISETVKNFPNIRVLSQFEHRSDDHMSDPAVAKTYEELVALVGGKVDVIFSNTHDYDDYFSKYLPDSEHVVFYENRELVNVSATQIRNEGVYRHWGMLPSAVQRFYQRRICLVGIESSGKTHMSRMLAELFNTTAVPEYGRLFYEKINAYSSVDSPADYVDIAVGHCHLLNEAAFENHEPVIFSDTDLIYTQFFHEQSYGTKHPVLDALIEAEADKLDLRLWLEPHNPHELDGTRLEVNKQERSKNREQLLGLYKHYGVDLIVIDEPNRDKRFQKCVQAVQNILAN